MPTISRLNREAEFKCFIAASEYLQNAIKLRYTGTLFVDIRASAIRKAKHYIKQSRAYRLENGKMLP